MNLKSYLRNLRKQCTDVGVKCQQKVPFLTLPPHPSPPPAIAARPESILMRFEISLGRVNLRSDTSWRWASMFIFLWPGPAGRRAGRGCPGIGWSVPKYINNNNVESAKTTDFTLRLTSLAQRGIPVLGRAREIQPSKLFPLIWSDLISNIKWYQGYTQELYLTH